MKVIITFTFCCDNLWKSKFMALEKPGKLAEFFSPPLWPPFQSGMLTRPEVYEATRPRPSAVRPRPSATKPRP